MIHISQRYIPGNNRGYCGVTLTWRNWCFGEVRRFRIMRDKYGVVAVFGQWLRAPGRLAFIKQGPVCSVCLNSYNSADDIHDL